jgi:hypothetical protein
LQLGVDQRAEHRARLAQRVLAVEQHEHRGVEVVLGLGRAVGQLAQLVERQPAVVGAPVDAGLHHPRDRRTQGLAAGHVDHVQLGLLRATGRDAVGQRAAVPRRAEVVDRVRHAGGLGQGHRVHQHTLGTALALAQHQPELALALGTLQVEQPAARPPREGITHVTAAACQLGDALAQRVAAVDARQLRGCQLALAQQPLAGLRVLQVLEVAERVFDHHAVVGVGHRHAGRRGHAGRGPGQPLRHGQHGAGPQGVTAMSLHRQLQQRAAEGRPIRVALIGAGKFGSMYLAQVPRTPGVHLVGIADLSPEAACRNLARVGWEPQRVQAASLDAALRDGSTHVGDDWQALVATRRSTSSSSAPATPSPRSTIAWRPSRTASTWST